MHQALKDLLARAGGERIVVLTGAGVSAASGVPTFRGEEGYWTVGSQHYHPTELATNQAFSQMPDDVWSWYLYRRGVCRQAEPNSAHLACVALEQALGDRFLLVTQNVDGLHLRAGNSLERTYQVHGNIDFMRCWNDCTPGFVPIPEGVPFKQRGESLDDHDRRLLVCPKCGGLARPHVLWFDECYDEAHFRFHSSLEATLTCGALVVAGSSGATNLPMQMAVMVSGRGGVMIDINPEANPFARMAEACGGLWLRTDAVDGLSQVAECFSAIA
ncbi:MAG: NAD-dependent deacetylase [Vulcanimicrobiota bacterium]